MKTDLAASTSFNAASHAAGTVGASHIHDVMEAFAAQFLIVNDAPATASFATTAVSAGADIIILTAHGYKSGLGGLFTTTTTLPAGLDNTTTFYLNANDANTVSVHATRAAALAGTSPVNITNAGTGTHSFKPAALAGVDVHLEKSIDGVTWTDIAGSTLAAAGTDVQSYTGIAYNYVRFESTLTAGQMSVTGTFRSRGQV